VAEPRPGADSVRIRRHTNCSRDIEAGTGVYFICSCFLKTFILYAQALSRSHPTHFCQYRALTEVVNIGFALREQIADDEKSSGFEYVENRLVRLLSLLPHVMEDKIGDGEVILCV
jgi:hypothetical protein